jgi:uncharacterized protein YjlB
MYSFEAAKGKLERITGIGWPSARQAKKLIQKRRPQAIVFNNNGYVPNNPKFPFLHYRNVVSLTKAPDPAAVFECLFKTNGWAGAWRNGIYDYIHFHPRTHEVLGVARGRARVRFGGTRGKTVSLRTGDVVILPAGTGHQALTVSKDLLVVGAYPVSGKYDEFRARPADHTKALRMIPKVRAPTKDPVFGKKGPLKRLWK